MERPLKIAFDIDDTLLVPSVATGFGNDTPNYDTVAIFKWFQKMGCDMILWSGSGHDWAQRWGEKLGLQPFRVLQKEAGHGIDICFDDCVVELAKVNVRVKRINNGKSRKEWNERKMCVGCGNELKPALECKNSVTGEWDGHSYTCDCLKSAGLIISIG